MCGPDVQQGGVTLLASPGGGRHPSGNSLLISGTDRTVPVDPSLARAQVVEDPAVVDDVQRTSADDAQVLDRRLPCSMSTVPAGRYSTSSAAATY